MRTLIFLMLLGLLTAQDLPTGKSRQPKLKTPFYLTYWDIRNEILNSEMAGKILVEFDVSETGKVENPVIKDTFNLNINDTVIDKVMAIEFKPALQNGKPVRVRYKLPIVFK